MINESVTLTDLEILFIGGLHRSGTSLLHEILRSHPEISGFTDTGVPEDEGQHLQTVIPAVSQFGGPGRFGFDPRSFMDETHPLATRASAEAMLSEWGKHWDFDKRVLIEKSPPNLIRSRFLQALFPRSSFVMMFRNPVVVAYATRKWNESPVYELIEHNLRCYEQALIDLNALNRAYLLHYEELAGAPRTIINDLFRFANLDEYQPHALTVQSSNGAYFQKWINERDAVIEAAEAAEPGWRDRTEARCQKLGYSLYNHKYTAKPLKGALEMIA